MELKKITNKKAQFKIQQTAFMILGTVLFFVLVGLFWLTLKSSSINKSAANIKQEEAITLALTIADSPELTCGTQCIDYDKAQALKNTRLFEAVWPIRSIEIRKIYPKIGGGTIIECNSGNIDSCNLIRIENKGITSSNGGTASSYVKICRKEKNAEGYTYDKCQFGEITIKT
ncbi:MAG: hypothetical protein AABW73_02950 [Nanoarchaeota archaeon]